MHRFLLSAPNQRPPYYRVAEYLWGIGCDFDSDGDSSQPEATDWTELTVTLRRDPNERVDIDPVDGEGPLVLAITSEQRELAHRAGRYLQGVSGGELTEA